MSFDLTRRTAPGIASLFALSIALATPAMARGADATADDAASAGNSGDALESAASDSSILVSGTRASDAIAAKRDAIGVSEVMSRDELKVRAGATVVDVISHLPGLSGSSDMGLGQAATGEQEFVSIRGIDSSYNAYTMNGVRLPQADPNSRALSLKMLPPNGIQSVVVSKTPSVDMDGDAIGGIIDIRTPTAFDYDGPHIGINVQGHGAQLARRSGADWGGGGASAEFARRFGNGAWGIYATAFYDEKNTAGQTVEATGYAPDLASEASDTNYRDISGLTATGVRYDYYVSNIKRFGGNASLDYRGATQTFSLQGSYARYKMTGEETQHSILNGQKSLYSNGTTYSPVGIMPGGYFQLRDQTEQMITVKAKGTTDLGKLHLAYEGSFGRSTTARPNYIEGSLYGTVNTTGYATGIDLSNPANTKVSYDSDATRDYALNPDGVSLWKFQGSDSSSAANMYTGRFDATYDVKSGILDTLVAGFKVSATDRNQYQHQFFGDNGDNFVIVDSNGVKRPFDNPAGPVSSALPGRNLSSILGNYAGTFRVYDRSTFENGVLPYIYTDQYALDADGNVVGNPGAYTVNDYNRYTVKGQEDIYAAYAAANFKIGDLTAAAGLRYEYTHFSSSQWSVDGDTGAFQKSGNNYGELLPSLILSYRPNAELVLRGAARRSFTRPAFGLLASPVVISRNDITGDISGISAGNPDLKASTANNYDLSAEWYGAHDTVLSVAGYYKTINDFIYSASSTGALPSASNATSNNGGVTTSIPENGKDADLYGIELNARHYLRDLPGFLSGFGVGGTLTLQRSSADSGRTDHYGRKTWLPRAPETIYNLDLFYDAHGVHANLAYQYQGLQLLGLTSNNLDTYLQPSKTLDLSVGYTFGNVSISGSVQNLTNNVLFYKTLGKSKQYLGTQDGGGNGSYVATGRFFNLSASLNF
ncbi:TonB-dependent receptor [Novosphingobium sp. PhB165]|uniref:TonB-dependent receptor n=1 Tax=Novosphingobium sp. PhB165 TaxID=2485105 RepID=UPI00104E5680|nr:TonB-dependent receptor [Novosphingobium sp. PhB165]TCM16570.1 TonB-dependent receptor [Novosphingobium sp. PhB165]